MLSVIRRPLLALINTHRGTSKKGGIREISSEFVEASGTRSLSEPSFTRTMSSWYSGLYSIFPVFPQVLCGRQKVLCFKMKGTDNTIRPLKDVSIPLFAGLYFLPSPKASLYSKPPTKKRGW